MSTTLHNIRFRCAIILSAHNLPFSSPSTMSEQTISLKVEFGGGLELLFSNQRSHKVSIPAYVPPPPDDAPPQEKPSGRRADITYLMYWLRDNLLKEREELFIENGTVCVPVMYMLSAITEFAHLVGLTLDDLVYSYWSTTQIGS